MSEVNPAPITLPRLHIAPYIIALYPQHMTSEPAVVTPSTVPAVQQ